MKKQKYIRLKNELIPVSEEIFSLYRRAARKARYFKEDLKSERYSIDLEKEKIHITSAREDSLDRLMENGQEFPDSSIAVEDDACYLVLRESLYKSLAQLTNAERQLIQELYFKGKSERQLAEEIDVPFMTLHNRKQQILLKLLKSMKKIH